MFLKKRGNYKKSHNYLIKIFLIVLLVGYMEPSLAASMGNMQQPAVVKISLPPFHDTSMLLVGQKKGFFKQNGVKLEFIESNWNQQYDLIASESVDIIFSTLSEFVSKEKSLKRIQRPVEYILPAWEYKGLAFFANNNIKSLNKVRQDENLTQPAEIVFLNQLNDKKIVFPEGSVFEQAFTRFLSKVNMNLSDFTIVNASVQAGLNGLEDPKVGVAAVGSNDITEARKRGYEVAVSPKDLGMLIITGFVGRAAKTEKMQKTYAGFACGWYETVRYVLKNKDESYTLIEGKLKARGAKVPSLESFKELLTLNVIPLYPKETETHFFNDGAPADWHVNWDVAVEGLIKNKKTTVPEDNKGFVAPEIVSTSKKRCPTID